MSTTINKDDIYNCFAVIVPLYLTISVGWLFSRYQMMTKVQLSGIQQFIMSLAVPAVVFQLLSKSDLYTADYTVVLADTLFKLVAGVGLWVWFFLLAPRVRCLQHAGSHDRLGSFLWSFNVATFPNTLIIGVPLISAMYGKESETTMILIVVAQTSIQVVFVVVLYELRKVLMERGEAIASLRHLEPPLEASASADAILLSLTPSASNAGTATPVPRPRRCISEIGRPSGRLAARAVAQAHAQGQVQVEAHQPAQGKSSGRLGVRERNWETDGVGKNAPVVPGWAPEDQVTGPRTGISTRSDCPARNTGPGTGIPTTSDADAHSKGPPRHLVMGGSSSFVDFPDASKNCGAVPPRSDLGALRRGRCTEMGGAAGLLGVSPPPGSQACGQLARQGDGWDGQFQGGKGREGTRGEAAMRPESGHSGHCGRCGQCACACTGKGPGLLRNGVGLEAVQGVQVLVAQGGEAGLPGETHCACCARLQGEGRITRGGYWDDGGECSEAQEGASRGHAGARARGEPMLDRHGMPALEAHPLIASAPQSSAFEVSDGPATTDATRRRPHFWWQACQGGPPTQGPCQVVAVPAGAGPGRQSFALGGGGMGGHIPCQNAGCDGGAAVRKLIEAAGRDAGTQDGGGRLACPCRGMCVHRPDVADREHVKRVEDADGMSSEGKGDALQSPWAECGPPGLGGAMPGPLRLDSSISIPGDSLGVAPEHGEDGDAVMPAVQHGAGSDAARIRIGQHEGGAAVTRVRPDSGLGIADIGHEAGGVAVPVTDVGGDVMGTIEDATNTPCGGSGSNGARSRNGRQEASGELGGVTDVSIMEPGVDIGNIRSNPRSESTGREDGVASGGGVGRAGRDATATALGEGSAREGSTWRSGVSTTAEAMAVLLDRKMVTRVVLKNLVHNPIIQIVPVAIAYSLLAFRFDFGVPTMLDNFVRMFSNTVYGLAVFTLGMFIQAHQLLSAGSYYWVASLMFIRFLVAPIGYGVLSWAVGLSGTLLKVMVIQASLPQAVLSFALANQYKAHTEIISTSIVVTTITGLPIALIYYVVLEKLQIE